MHFISNRLLALLVCFVIILGLLPAVSAEPTAAQDLTSTTAITGSGYNSYGFLKDGNIKTYVRSAGNTTLTLQNEKGIGSLYLMFDLEYGEYTVVNNDTGDTATAGEFGILHEYVDLVKLFGSDVKSVTLKFENGAVRLSEIFSFTVGETPSFVQKWNAPLEEADLVLFATHGDDDQLFFAGLLPKYAALGYAVQVVYLTDHRNLTYARTHEMINGLWNVGIRAYPVFGRFADFRIDDLNDTYNYYAQLGTTKNDLQSYVVEQIRRFKPKVAVGHDPKGEYGHGMHMVYSELLTKALDLTGKADAFPESAEKYGTWEIQKTYLHLYGENKVVIDYDSPMENLGGMTPFEVTQKYGYPCHESQQWTWFTRWINGTMDEVTIHKASAIATYNPCQFGLVRSSVGADVAKNDFMENIESYAQQHAREEAERKEKEDAERSRLDEIMQGLEPLSKLSMTESEQQTFAAIKSQMDAMKAGQWKEENAQLMEQLHEQLQDLDKTVKERLEREQIQKEEAERREQEEKERLEKEKQEQEKLQAEQRRKELTTALAVLAVLVLMLILLIAVLRAQNIRRHNKRMIARSRKK